MARLESRVAALEAPLVGTTTVVRCISLTGQVGEPTTICRVGTDQCWRRTDAESAELFRKRVDAQLGRSSGLIVLSEKNIPVVGEIE